MMTNGTPWYEKTLWICVWLIVFTPVGIYGMWKSSRALLWKVIVTVLSAGMYIVGFLIQLTAFALGY